MGDIHLFFYFLGKKIDVLTCDLGFFLFLDS